MMDIIRNSFLDYTIRTVAADQFRNPDEDPITDCVAQPHRHHVPSAGGVAFSSDPEHRDSLAKAEQHVLICDWRGDDDPENPRNWSRTKKLFVVANVAACSFVVYGTAPIWTPSTDAFISEYGTNHAYTSLGLSLFV